MSRPNIIIFCPDHFRAEALAHLGNPAAVTPNLDRLAEEGVSFRNAFCQAPVCVPSRCSFMSGWYPHVRGHRTMFHLMHPGEPVLLKTLKDNGYFVWWAGKNDLVAGQFPLDPYCHVRYRPDRAKHNGIPCDPEAPWRGGRGSDNFYSFYYGRLDTDGGEVFCDSDWADVCGAVDVIRTKPRQPFCLFLALTRPHPPFAVEEPWYSMIDRNALAPCAPVPEDWGEKAGMLKGICQRSRLEHWTGERWSELRATFYGMCARVDHQFGLLLAALQESGLYENTAVFFLSDHGLYAGDFGVVGVNQNTFEDVLTRVAFLVKPPASTEVRPGIRDALVELVDFPATVMDMAGLEPGHSHFGRSLLPLISGRADEHRDAVFCEGGRLPGEEHCKELEYAPGSSEEDIYWPRLGLQAGDGPEHTKAVMCRTRDYKYVRRLCERDELYDLKADPLEQHNRIDDPALADVLAGLRERLLRFYLETADVVPYEPDLRGDPGTLRQYPMG